MTEMGKDEYRLRASWIELSMQRIWADWKWRWSSFNRGHLYDAKCIGEDPSDKEDIWAMERELELYQQEPNEAR